MVDVPAAKTAAVFCNNVSISDGTDNFVAGKNLTMTYGYTVIEENVIGDPEPFQATGPFEGTIEFELLASTDADVHDWVTPTGGEIPTTTLTLGETDTAGTPLTRTWTVAAKIREFRLVYRDLQFAVYRVAGRLTQEPTEAVT